MFLSRIELDTGRQDTRRALSSPQVLHAAIENCFLTKNGAKDRKLWRVDNLNNRLYVLVLSPEKPDFSLFVSQFCAADVTGEIKDYQPLLTRMRDGTRLRFRIRGNPVHSVAKEKGVRGKIYAHVTPTQQREWLAKKAPSCGFELPENSFDVVETKLLRFSRGEKNRLVEIRTAVFEGELLVTDAALFVQTLTQGIGRAKAYGCGLMTVIFVK